MATALLLLRAAARRDYATRLPHFLSHNSSVLARAWGERGSDEAAAVVGRGYRTLASELEKCERSWTLTDFLSRRGFSVKSGAELEQGSVVEGEKKVAKKVGRPRKVEDGGEKAKRKRRPRASMKRLEEEIAANEAASGSGISPVKLKLTTTRRRSVSVVESVAVAGAESREVSGSSFDDSRFDVGVGVAPQLGEEVGELGSEEEFKGQGSSALVGSGTDRLNLKAGGESSNAILSLLVEDGESQVEKGVVRSIFPPLKSRTPRESVDAPPRTAPRFPKLDLTSKQRIARVELDGDDKGNERGAKVVVPDQYSDPKKVFQMLQHARPGAYTSAEKARLSWIFHRFAESGLVRFPQTRLPERLLQLCRFQH